MSKGDLAKEYFMQGYNCAQSVALAFSDIIDMDKTTLLKAISPFGGGMGRLREVCGAVSGMFFVLGCVLGYDDANEREGKIALYKHVQTLAQKFKEENGSIICRDLIGVSGAEQPTPEKRTEKYYKKRPCAEMVKTAGDILEEFLASTPMLINND